MRRCHDTVSPGVLGLVEHLVGAPVEIVGEEVPYEDVAEGGRLAELARERRKIADRFRVDDVLQGLLLAKNPTFPYLSASCGQRDR